MYLIYIDESGKPNWIDKENYVLVGFCINEKNYKKINQQVDDLKLKYFSKKDLDNVELHAQEIVYNRKVFTSLTYSQRFHLLEDVYSLISQIECVLSASIIMKNNIMKKDLDIELWGFRLLFDRLCQHLDTINDDGNQNEYGILLLDSINPSYDVKLRHKIIDMMRNGTYYTDNKYIIEDPLFVTSQYRNMSQLVDCVAYCTRRYYRIVVGKNKSYLDINFEKFFNIIKNKFYKSPEGKIDGWGIKIFPKS